MPIYEFRCKKCRTISNSLSREQPECQLCKARMSRNFGFNLQSSFQPHYNTAVGAYVSNQTEFNDLLKSKSDEQSERTGIHANYIPVEQGDAQAFGANDEGMDSFYREHYNNPITESLD